MDELFQLNNLQKEILADIEDEYTEGNSFTSEEEALIIWLLESGWL